MVGTLIPAFLHFYPRCPWNPTTLNEKTSDESEAFIVFSLLSQKTLERHKTTIFLA